MATWARMTPGSVSHPGLQPSTRGLYLVENRCCTTLQTTQHVDMLAISTKLPPAYCGVSNQDTLCHNHALDEAAAELAQLQWLMQTHSLVKRYCAGQRGILQPAGQRPVNAIPSSTLQPSRTMTGNRVLQALAGYCAVHLTRSRTCKVSMHRATKYTTGHANHPGTKPPWKNCLQRERRSISMHCRSTHIIILQRVFQASNICPLRIYAACQLAHEQRLACCICDRVQRSACKQIYIRSLLTHYYELDKLQTAVLLQQAPCKHLLDQPRMVPVCQQVSTACE